MSTHAMLTLEEAIHHSRRSFWMLLLIFIVFTASALLISIGGTVSTTGSSLLRMSPIFMAILLGLTGGGLASSKARRAAFKALAADELRMQSLSSAYRVAFFAALIAQPVLALLAATVTLVHPIGFMAAGTIGLATISFLSSFLWLDR